MWDAATGARCFALACVDSPSLDTNRYDNHS
jgi:hypothetical protein